MTPRTALLSVTCLLLAAVSGCKESANATAAANASLDDNFERTVLVIVADDGSQHEFDVYLAVAFEQKRRGLMFVRELPERSGMLFTYGDDDIRTMWMKNTYISLDLVFVRRDGSVASLIRDAQPLSLQTLSSEEPVRYVLELNAGVARRYNIGRSSRIIWEPGAGSQRGRD